MKTKMMEMKTKMMRFLQDEEGLTIVEYAVAAALVSAAAVLAFTTLGQNVATVIGNLAAVIVTP